MAAQLQQWAVGERVGSYFVRRRIGRGGMGETYLAERIYADDVGSLNVCLKRVIAAGDMESRVRFRREASALLAMNHPGIVRFVDYFVYDDALVLAMEWVDANDLRELRTTTRLDIARVASIAAQVARALEHAHAAGHLHRDLSPENIMVGPGDEVRLTDFGLAFAIHEANRLTSHTEWIGKNEYSPPEVLTDEPLTYACDTYALGAMVYECVTGRHVQSKPGDTLPAGLREVFPAELADLVAELLDPLPGRRPSAAEAAERFEAYPTPPRPRAVRLYTGLALLAFMLSLAGLLLPWATSTGTAPAATTETEPPPLPLPRPPAPAQPPTPAPAPPVAEAKAEPAPALAVLRVIAVPYGEVAIDGKQRGMGPVTVRLPAGRHTIVVQLPTGTQRRTVTLEAGKARKVLFR